MSTFEESDVVGKPVAETPTQDSRSSIRYDDSSAAVAGFTNSIRSISNTQQVAMGIDVGIAAAMGVAHSLSRNVDDDDDDDDAEGLQISARSFGTPDFSATGSSSIPSHDYSSSSMGGLSEQANLKDDLNNASFQQWAVTSPGQQRGNEKKSSLPSSSSSSNGQQKKKKKARRSLVALEDLKGLEGTHVTEFDDATEVSAMTEPPPLPDGSKYEMRKAKASLRQVWDAIDEAEEQERARSSSDEDRETRSRSSRNSNRSRQSSTGRRSVGSRQKGL
jgi:hypothetical protein